jgi:large subunit ribosomal protein L31
VDPFPERLWIVKPGIHPTWYPDAIVTCACGNTWTTGSTKKEIHTDVCSKCHPFFTGEQRIVDTAGQVERFMKRISAKEQISATQPAPETKKAKKERRRERKTGVAPAELPRAEVAAEAATAVGPDVIPEPGTEEIAPVSTVENLRAEENVEILPPGEIGQTASVDKVIEPTDVLQPSEKGRPGSGKKRVRTPKPRSETKAVVEKPVDQAGEAPKAERPAPPPEPQAGTPEEPEDKGTA